MSERIIDEVRNLNEVGQTLPSSKDLVEIQTTFDLLQKGDRTIPVGADKDAVLLLGLTGTGKSTLTQFIAGDNTVLKAEYINGVMVINDGNDRIGNSTINSQTIYPEMVFHSKSGAALYDCPGFSDTRNSSYDIAASYFIKKVVDHVRRVKLVFATSQSSVKVGNDREGFVKLLNHACALMTNVDKLADGISLVVTKVDNEYRRDVDRTLKLQEDEVVIANIVGFMKEVRRDLLQRHSSLDADDENSSICKCAIKLVNIFMLKDDGKYMRLGIFRRPEEEGPLTKSPLLEKGKQNIEAIIFNHTEFIDHGVDDFNYTISDTSKYYITQFLNRKLNENIKTSLTRLANAIQEKFVDAYISSDDLYVFKSKLDDACNSLRQITTGNKSSNHMNFIDVIERNMKPLLVSENDILIDVRNKMGYFEFFQRFSKSKSEFFSILQGADCFTQVSNFVTNINSWLSELLQLYNKHSNYQFENQANRYNVSYLAQYGEGGKVYNFNASNVKIFLKDLALSSAHNFSFLDAGPVQTVALRDLNNVMNLAFKQYTISCEEALESSLEVLAKEIENKYSVKCKEITDFTSMRAFHLVLDHSYQSLDRLIKSNFTSENEFKIKFLTTLDDVGIYGPLALTHIDKHIAHRQLYRNFMRSNHTNSSADVWSSILKPAHAYIGKLESWYEFILNVHDELTRMSMEINIGQIKDTEHWVSNPLERISQSNVATFVLKLQQLKSMKSDSILTDNSLTQIVLRDLNILGNFVSYLAASWENSIVSELYKITTAIEMKYSKLCTDSNDKHSLLNELNIGNNILRELMKSNIADTDDFTKKINNVLQKMKVMTAPDVLSRISSRINSFIVFKGFTVDERKHFNPSQWMSALSSAGDYINNQINWYTFLLDLYEKLSGYFIQKDTIKYNVADIDYWGDGSRTRGIVINKGNILKFLQKVEDLQVASFYMINTTNIDEAVFKDLNRILSLTLRHEARLTESYDSLTIQDNFVVLSDYAFAFQNTKYTSLEVYALNTIFIDVDIKRLGEEFQLTIIAPTWDIQGCREFVLDGHPGNNYEYAAREAEDGRPGEPGSNGGTFLGIGREFRRGSSLSVSARGGKGGRGQDGGEGENDERHIQSSISEKDTVKDICKGWFPEDRFKIVDSRYKLFYTTYYYTVFPWYAGRDGNPSARDGGDGGRGGYGGHAGSIDLIHLDRKESGVDTAAVRGPKGIGGRGGKGARETTGSTFHFYMRFTGGLFGCSGGLDETRSNGAVIPEGRTGLGNTNTNYMVSPHATRGQVARSRYKNTFIAYSKEYFALNAASPKEGAFLESLQTQFKVR